MCNPFYIYKEKINTTFSSFPLSSSASTFFTAFLTVHGAPSTRSLASFRPRPRIALTSLMILIFYVASIADNSKSKFCCFFLFFMNYFLLFCFYFLLLCLIFCRLKRLLGSLPSCSRCPSAHSHLWQNSSHALLTSWP